MMVTDLETARQLKDMSLTETLTFLQNPLKKVLLIKDQTGSDFTSLLQRYLKRNNLQFVHFNVSQTANIEAQCAKGFLKRAHIFLFTGFNEYGLQGNIYTKFCLDSWTAKIIIICDAALLHPTLDASLYFAPFRDNRIFKKIFAQSTWPISAVPQLTSQQSPAIAEAKPSNRQASSLLNHFLNQKLMTGDLLIMRMLAERVVESESFKVFLFELIYASRQQEAFKTAAANAITALKFANISFSGMDLSHIKIPYADLSYAIFDHTDFSGADLTGVYLKNAWLKSTNLQGTHLVDIHFGEQAYLEEIGGYTSIRCADFSLDGRWFATGISCDIHIWDIEQRKLIYILTHYLQQICDLAFSPDSKFLASASADNTIKLWQTANFLNPKMLAGHNDAVEVIAFHPNGVLLASGSKDRTIILWDIIKGESIYMLVGYTQKLTDIVFSSDGKKLFSAYKDNNIVVWNDIEDKGQQEEVQPFQLELNNKDEWVYNLAVSPNGRFLVANSSYDIYLWDLENYGLLCTLLGHAAKKTRTFTEIENKKHKASIYCLAFSADSKSLVFSSEDNTIRIWDIESAKVNHVLFGHTDKIVNAKFDPTSKIVVSASRDNTIRFWEVGNADVMSNLHSQGVTQICLDPAGKMLASADGQIIVLWDAKLRSVKRILKNENKIYNLAFSPDGRILTVVLASSIQLWDINTGQVNQISEDAYNIVFTPSGKTLILANNETIKLWDIEENTVKYRLLEVNNLEVDKSVLGYFFITGLALDSTGKILATAHYGGDVWLWDMELGKIKNKLKPHKRCSIHLYFSPNNKLLTACKRAIRIWDVEIGQCIYKLRLDHCIGINFTFISSTLFAFSRDNNILIWDIEKGQCQVILEGHLNDVTSLSWHPQVGLVSGSNDTTIKFWSLTVDNKQLPRWRLSWSSLNSVLYTNDCLWHQAQNLSPLNQQLLKQRVFVGKPRTIKDTNNRYTFFKEVSSSNNSETSITARITNSFNNTQCIYDYSYDYLRDLILEETRVSKQKPSQ
jgi:WD40 repeat protein